MGYPETLFLSGGILPEALNHRKDISPEAAREFLLKQRRGGRILSASIDGDLTTIKNLRTYFEEPMAGWLYRCGRFFLNQTVRLYYRRIEVTGGDRIPATGPAIVVANHPNSVTDAFLLASQLTERRLNFIAKDSIPNHPIYGWLVRKFGVVGVARGIDYERQRDLSRQRNQSAVNTCVPRLQAGEIVAIFGEGISYDVRRLQMIRKGALRFGYAAEKACNFALGLVWIPVGITYTAKHHFRSDVLIRVGSPFRLTDVHAQPAGNEAVTLQRGTERLRAELESLVVNIERDHLAGLIDRLNNLVGNPAGSLDSQVKVQQRLARAVDYFNVTEPHKLKALEGDLIRYDQKLATQELTDQVVRQRNPSFRLWSSGPSLLGNSLLMLLNTYGWANSFIPRWTAYLLRPFGRVQEATPGAGPGSQPYEVFRDSLWGTYGGWAGAAVAFPLQAYLVYRVTTAHYGAEVGAAVSALYALSLIPSWRLFIRRRDIFRQRLANMSDALRFLLNAGPAMRLQRHRRKLVRQARSLLAAYDRRAPAPDAQHSLPATVSLASPE